jgi:endonuclease III
VTPTPDAPDAPGPPEGDKVPFDIDEAMARLRTAVQPFPPAMLFELAAEGHDSAFEVLVACMISIRTRDETSLPVARRLFAQARTPAQMVALPPETIDTLIRECSFHYGKARQIHAIARQAVDELGGAVPCDFDVLTAFPGVGPKCANLVLGIACGVPRVGVDVHVYRVTNRWGYVKARTPELTMEALEEALPERYQVEINRLLVPFGKHICTGALPRCSSCTLLDMCRQVGVGRHR